MRALYTRTRARLRALTGKLVTFLDLRDRTRTGLHYFHSWFVLILVFLSVCIFLSSPPWRWSASPDIWRWRWRTATTTLLGQKPSVPCNIPQLDPFDTSVLEFLEPAPELNCASPSGGYPKLFRTNFNNKLIRMVKIDGRCCYKTLERTAYSDLITKFSKRCTPITRTVTTIPSSVEFIQVQCEMNNATTTTTKFADMFAFVPQKSKPAPGLGEDQLNILLLGLDGQSHMNFIRQMPLTYNYLMQNLSESNASPVTVFEMNGYAKVGDNTFPNVIPLLAGLSVQELVAKCWATQYTYFDECPFIWKKFAGIEGYKTLYAEDSVWMGIFQYEKLGFYSQPTDYYLNPFILQLASKMGHETQGNSKLCYGPRLAFEVLLEYMVKTFVQFGNTTTSREGHRFFEFIWANSLFHDYLNHPKLGDELLFMTLEWLTTRNYLNNTLLILASDHGARWGSIRNTYQGRLEERLPMLYFILPKWFSTKYSTAVANLRENQDRLTTPFDIHESFLDLLDVSHNLNNEALENVAVARSPPTNRRGMSLFRAIPATRSCDQAEVAAHWCICSRMVPISTTALIVEEAAVFVVRSVNAIISNHTHMSATEPCAKLNLDRITSAMRKVDVDIDGVEGDDHKETGFKNNSITTSTADVDIELQLSLSVEPSRAVLEATVYRNKNTGFEWRLSGEISRLNLYGDQSDCISDPMVQKYCYCTRVRVRTDNDNDNATDTKTMLMTETAASAFNWYEDESKPLAISS